MAQLSVYISPRSPSPCSTCDPLFMAACTAALASSPSAWSFPSTVPQESSPSCQRLMRYEDPQPARLPPALCRCPLCCSLLQAGTSRWLRRMFPAQCPVHPSHSPASAHCAPVSGELGRGRKQLCPNPHISPIPPITPLCFPGMKIKKRKKRTENLL